MKELYRIFDWDMTLRYIAAFAFFSIFIISMKGLARYSDSLTVHYSLKVLFTVMSSDSLSRCLCYCPLLYALWK